MKRNLSVQRYLCELAQKHEPKYRFSGNSSSDWQSWRSELFPKVKASLGKLPQSVPLNPEVIAEWRDGGLIKQKVVFDVEQELSATAYVFRPESSKGKLPGILACHGHGPYGKDSVMGINCDPERKSNIGEHNYDYGLQMAKAGFVTIAIDWRGFGERDDRRKPFYRIFGDRDLCNLHYLRATLLGMTVLGMDIHDGKCALDYLCGLDCVDSERIGCMGLSFGGTMTTWMTIMDERVKAADIICYSDMFEEFAFVGANTCGSQISPGLFELCNVPDLQGLIAPRPLLIEIGAYDECFKIDSAMECFTELSKIYNAAGISEKLELDLFDGGHGFAGNKAFNFFKKYL